MVSMSRIEKPQTVKARLKVYALDEDGKLLGVVDLDPYFTAKGLVKAYFASCGFRVYIISPEGNTLDYFTYPDGLGAEWYYDEGYARTVIHLYFTMKKDSPVTVDRITVVGYCAGSEHGTIADFNGLGLTGQAFAFEIFIYINDSTT